MISVAAAAAGAAAVVVVLGEISLVMSFPSLLCSNVNFRHISLLFYSQDQALLLCSVVRVHRS